jgi:hypothetical protein
MAVPKPFTLTDVKEALQGLVKGVLKLLGGPHRLGTSGTLRATLGRCPQPVKTLSTARRPS